MVLPTPDTAPPSLAPRMPAQFAEADRAARVRLATLMVGAGVMHFVVPKFYARIIPKWVPGDPMLHVYWSGVLELVAGVLVTVPRTRRLGAWLSLATLVVVYPANIQMALDAGRPTDAQGIAVWLRLPLQFPMFRLAYRVARPET